MVGTHARSQHWHLPWIVWWNLASCGQKLEIPASHRMLVDFPVLFGWNPLQESLTSLGFWQTTCGADFPCRPARCLPRATAKRHRQPGSSSTGGLANVPACIVCSNPGTSFSEGHVFLGGFLLAAFRSLPMAIDTAPTASHRTVHDAKELPWCLQRAEYEPTLRSKSVLCSSKTGPETATLGAYFVAVLLSLPELRQIRCR